MDEHLDDKIQWVAEELSKLGEQDPRVPLVEEELWRWLESGDQDPIEGEYLLLRGRSLLTD